MKHLESELCKHGHEVYKFIPKIGPDRDSRNDICHQPAVRYIFQKEYSAALPLPYGALRHAR
ncbi:MAG: hypothetical protein EHM28_03715, partial [Spirochaetaceae bacterium]